MKRFLGMLLFLVALGWPGEAAAQPTDLYECVTRPPIPFCNGTVMGYLTDLGCGQTYKFYSGRVAWYPLRCVGPITLEINARALRGNRYPLYVEIVPAPPYPGPPGYSPCYGPGYVVMIARGGWTCGTWESAEVDITRFIAVDSTYALQVACLATTDGYNESPGLDCVRVTAHPVSSPVAALNWARIKVLYR